MKKVSRYIFLFALPSIFALLGTSCANRNRHPEKTKALDSLALLLDSANATLAKSDSVLIRNHINHVFIIVEQVQSNVIDKKDTISRGAAEILRTLNGIRWQLETYSGRKPVLMSVMKQSAIQLRNLRHDIANNRIPADSVNVYYNLETKKADELLETAQQSFKLIETEMPFYDMMAPKADSLIGRLNRHQGI
ncbi:MAG: hypothetical protein HKL88_06175 [Bacteroidia bacterium]|jgi:hypothetical protein|nr:hypothetical protein [Bacteroidia bacterium]